MISQYGAIGASGIRKLTGKTLDAETKTSITGFTSALTMEPGATYLIILHDGSFAKLRIARILPDQGASITKVQFTYIEILADGTYRWLNLKKLYTGKWSSSGDGQILIYGRPMQSDWYMSLTAQSEAKIYAWGLEYKAYRMIG